MASQVDPKGFSFGEMLRQGREARNLSQEDVSAHLGVDVRSVQRWEADRTFPRPRHRRKLDQLLELHALGPSSFNADASPSSESPPRVSCLAIETLSLGEIQRRDCALDELFEQLPSLEAEWPIPDGCNNFLGRQQDWNDVAVASPDTHFYMLENERNVVGYWSFVPVTTTLYERILRGDNVNRDIRSADVLYPSPGSAVQVYFVDFFRMKRLSPAVFISAFYDSLTSVIRDWAALGILIDRVVAHLSTPEIITFAAERLDLEFRAQHSSHTMFDRQGEVTPSEIHELILRDGLYRPSFVHDLLLRANVLDTYREALGT